MMSEASPDPKWRVPQHLEKEMDLCHYGGSVRGKPGSWVAMSTCNGVQGIVFDGERIRYIEPAKGEDVNSDHYVYDHADLTTSRPRRCGNSDANGIQYLYENRTRKYKRNAPDEEILIESNQADDRSLYVELVLVVDQQHYEAHNRNLGSVHREMKTIANMLNSVYAQLNIYIALVGVVVWKDYDEIDFTHTSQTPSIQRGSIIILKNFEKYRKTKLVKKIPNDNAHLITHHEFEGDVVGKASIQTICTHGFSAGVSNYHTKVTGLYAMTIAHQMGHNFGMQHDDDEKCECQDKACIMSAFSTGTIPSRWSSCSLNSLALTFSRGMDICLRNKPKRLLDSPTPTCGNGLVEPGEKCDCGKMAAEGAYNPCHACCNPNTCTLRANATCGAGKCCDLQTCRLKSVGTVCRSADRECDLPEYCSGDSEHCPHDVYKMDTTPCKGQKAYCVNGRCVTHSDQCRILWGSSGQSCSMPFYKENMKGNPLCDCGFDRFQDIYKRCKERDVMCGRLHCKHLSELSNQYNYLKIGDSNSRVGSIMMLPDTNRTVTCYSTSIDLGLDVADFGMAPDGAKCGEGMMCLQQRCVSVHGVRESFLHGNSSFCQSNCSGHGVCNSKGHCHCDLGFSPPSCSDPGPGGSLISGPSFDVTILRTFMEAMYVIFLGIVPAFALIVLSILLA